MSESQTTTVQIYGREFKLRASEDGEYVQQIARYVDEKMRSISEESNMVANEKVAIMAAINIADELFQHRKQSANEMSDVEARAEKLIGIVDGSMQSAND